MNDMLTEFHRGHLCGCNTKFKADLGWHAHDSLLTGFIVPAAFATLSYLPENNLLDNLARHAVSIIGTFRPQATSNTLWAFAKLGYCPSRALLDAGSRQMLQDLSKSVPQVCCLPSTIQAALNGFALQTTILFRCLLKGTPALKTLFASDVL